MSRICLRVALVVVALPALAHPAAAQNREHQQMTAELRMLQEQTQQLALTLAQIGETLKALNARMDASDAAAQKRFADQKLLIDALGSDLSAIRERTQDTDTRLRKLSDEVDALRATVTQLPALLAPPPQAQPTDTSALDPNAPPPVAPPLTPVPPPLSAPPASAPPSTVGLSPSRMLETARSDYFAGAYQSAITGFDALLKAFPRTEAAAEAQFWLGESYSQLKRWNDAVIAYGATIQNYPRSNQVPDAYYKRGKALESLDLLDAARASYEQLMKIYPDTPSAGLAKQALDRLGRQTAATPRP